MCFPPPQVLRPGLVKGPWVKEEDDKIVECIANGITKWSEIASRIPGRIGKQCRERWCAGCCARTLHAAVCGHARLLVQLVLNYA